MSCAIKAVFFDIGNVLLNFDPHAVLREIAGVLGRPPRQVARFFGKPGRIEALERGELSIEGLYHIFREDLGYQGSYPRFKRLWCDHFTLDRRTAALLKEVAGRLPAYLLIREHPRTPAVQRPPADQRSENAETADEQNPGDEEKREEELFHWETFLDRRGLRSLSKNSRCLG